MIIVKSFIAVFIFFSFLNLACSKNRSTNDTSGQSPITASTDNPQQKLNVRMQGDFNKVQDGVTVQLRIEGLPPNSEHGLHIHEVGDCTPPSYLTAGDHFNPDLKPHGSPKDMGSHFGDLGNIISDAQGIYSGLIKIKRATTDGHYNILNRSLIVHEKADDFNSQPAGNSGRRLACIVISDI